MEQLVVLFLIVAALYVATTLIKTVLGIGLRYALFVAAAMLVYQDRYGTEVRRWMDAEAAGEIALVAGLALLVTAAASFFLRESKLRFLAIPAIGVAATVLAARVVAG